MTKKKSELKNAREEYERSLKVLAEAEKTWLPAREKFEAAKAAYYKLVLE